MEVQVNVSQGNGERVTGEYQGRSWHGFSDGLETWKSFRIPWNAKTKPEYVDSEIKWNFDKHVESIGMTGWNWVQRKSIYVAYDFDSILNHGKSGLSTLDLEDIIQKTSEVDYVTLRRSTSGHGVHLYVFLNPNLDIVTNNHDEHAALARYILGQLNASTGYDFTSKVDVCGGNMWVWDKRLQINELEGLSLIKKGGTLNEVSDNWVDHLTVINGKKRRINPINKLDINDQPIQSNETLDDFEDLCNKYPYIKLDDEHTRLLNYLRERNVQAWYDQDNRVLVTHTTHLKEAYEELDLKGYFNTISSGKDAPNDHNVFCHPMRNGAWYVRRFTKGTKEHDSWDQDAAGWTRCYLNKPLSLKIAARTCGGIEDTKGGFIFKNGQDAERCAQYLNSTLDLEPRYLHKKITLREHKDGRLMAELPVGEDEDLKDFLKVKSNWVKIYDTNLSSDNDQSDFSADDVVRHLIDMNNNDAGWCLFSDGSWRFEPLTNIRFGLNAMGFKAKDLNVILGNSVLTCWQIVSKPFEDEYPGNREWNMNSVQLKFTPKKSNSDLKYFTWQKILHHCGDSITPYIEKHPWCKKYGILTGAEYLKCWVASVIKYPYQPLPYLFFYGPSNSGKSTFHEAIKTLFSTNNAKPGVAPADVAIRSRADFNFEIEGAVVCTIEETDLRADKNAYNKIKNWVTSPDLLIHTKNKSPYVAPNTTHWIQCSNEISACPPMFGNDTRITMIYVDSLKEDIPKWQLMGLIDKEAHDFITELHHMELPPPEGRLRIPCIDTEEKQSFQRNRQSPVKSFIEECTVPANGYVIKYSVLFEEFVKYMSMEDLGKWSKKRFGTELDELRILKARSRSDNQYYVANIAFEEKEAKNMKYIIVDGYLAETDNT